MSTLKDIDTLELMSKYLVLISRLETMDLRFAEMEKELVARGLTITPQTLEIVKKYLEIIREGE